MKKNNNYLNLGWFFFLIGEMLYFIKIWHWQISHTNLILVLSLLSLLAALLIFIKYSYDNRLPENNISLKKGTTQK